MLWVNGIENDFENSLLAIAACPVSLNIRTSVAKPYHMYIMVTAPIHFLYLKTNTLAVISLFKDNL